MQQLKSAAGNRSQHFANLNQYQTPVQALGNWWQIDEAIYDEFLEMLPPAYCVGGFRMIERLTDNIAATFLKVGDRFFCGYTDCTVSPGVMLIHIREESLVPSN
jgi:hypothetical protein